MAISRLINVEVVADTDWISPLCMLFLLVVTAAYAFHDWALLARGTVGQPVTFSTVLLAIYAIWLGASVHEAIFRVAAFMIGFAAALSAALFYLHASSTVQRLASFNRLFLSLFGLVMIVVGTIGWFLRVSRVQKCSPKTQDQR